MTGKENHLEILKKKAGEKASLYVKNGMKIGLGTGSTATYFIESVAERIKVEGLDVEAIATSSVSEKLARELGIPLMKSFPMKELDLTVDGADEIDPNLNLIKGLGGALLMEKIIAINSKMEIIIADDTKIVDTLGSLSPIPVEVVKFGYEMTWKNLEKLGFSIKQRTMDKNGIPFVTDQNNYILDCYTQPMQNPEKISQEIKAITGVVDHGIFIGLAHKAIIARKDGIEEIDI